MKVLVVAVLLVAAACGSDGNAPPTTLEDEVTSQCDEHGNLVYLTEDDKNATPHVFVIPNDEECSSQ